MRNYILLIQGITNRTCSCLEHLEFDVFADQAAKVVKKELGIGELIKTILCSIKQEGLGKYLENYVQYLYPHDHKFRTMQQLYGNMLKQIDTVDLLVHRTEKQPLILSLKPAL